MANKIEERFDKVTKFENPTGKTPQYYKTPQ
jgi:hypothetical protein